MLFGLEGRVYVRMGERAKARESLLAAVTNGDRSGFTHNLLGLLELEAGEYSAALEHIKLACAVEPQSPDYSVWKENSRKAEETTIPSISRHSEVRSVAPAPPVFAGKGLVSRCAPIEEEIFAIGLGICPVAGPRFEPTPPKTV
jgi:hypothetical protein